MPYGELKSLPIPNNVFEELTLDFIIGLLLAKLDNIVYNAILVIVDRYLKASIYIPADTR